MIWSIFRFIVLMLAVPLVLGRAASRNLGKEMGVKAFTLSFLSGFCIMVALFEIISVPVTLMRKPFHVLFWLYAGVLGSATVLSAIRLLTKRQTRLPKMEREKFNWREKAWAIIFLVVFLLQVGLFVFLKEKGEIGDDASYLVRSNAILYYDELNTGYEVGPSTALAVKYALTCADPFYSFLAKACGANVATVAHLFIPPVVITMAYCAVYLIASYLCARREDRLLFLALTAVILQSSNYGYSFAGRLLNYVWQGKSISAVVILPFLFYLMPELTGKEFSLRGAGLLLAVSIACCGMTPTGILLSPLAIGLMGLLALISEKKIGSLYYAMVGCAPAVLLLALFLKLR